MGRQYNPQRAKDRGQVTTGTRWLFAFIIAATVLGPLCGCLNFVLRGCS